MTGGEDRGSEPAAVPYSQLSKPVEYAMFVYVRVTAGGMPSAAARGVTACCSAVARCATRLMKDERPTSSATRARSCESRTAMV